MAKPQGKKFNRRGGVPNGKAFSHTDQQFETVHELANGFGYRYSRAVSKDIALTITKQPNRPVRGIPYHHRPLNEYVKGLKMVGMCLEDMDEIFPDKDVQSLYGLPWKEPRYIVLHASLIK